MMMLGIGFYGIVCSNYFDLGLITYCCYTSEMDAMFPECLSWKNTQADHFKDGIKMEDSVPALPESISQRLCWQ